MAVRVPLSHLPAGERQTGITCLQTALVHQDASSFSSAGATAFHSLSSGPEGTKRDGCLVVLHRPSSLGTATYAFLYLPNSLVLS